jgi:drug/metabolite transporter (DMT)-like permease
MKKTSPLLVHAALLATALIYAASFTVAKNVMPAYIQPRGFILLRIMGALLLAGIVERIWIREKIRSARDYILLIASAFFGVALNMVLFFEGLSRTSPINAALIMVTTPIMVLLIGFFTGAEKFNKRKVAGIILGTIGAMMLISNTGGPGRQASAIGDLMVMINAASYAVYLLMVKPLINRYNPITIMLWTFIFGFLMVLPFSWHQVMEAHWSQMGMFTWIDVVFIVVFTTFMAYALNSWGLQHVKASVVGSYIYIQPLAGTLIAVSTGKYALHWEQIIFGLFIFAGVYLVSHTRHAVKPEDRV